MKMFDGIVKKLFFSEEDSSPVVNEPMEFRGFDFLWQCDLFVVSYHTNSLWMDPDSGHLDALLKFEYSRKMINIFMKDFAEKGIDTNKYDNYYCDIKKCVYDYENQRYLVVTDKSYDNKGNVIKSQTVGKWEYMDDTDYNQAILKHLLNAFTSKAKKLLGR